MCAYDVIVLAPKAGAEDYRGMIAAQLEDRDRIVQGLAGIIDARTYTESQRECGAVLAQHVTCQAAAPCIVFAWTLTPFSLLVFFGVLACVTVCLLVLVLVPNVHGHRYAAE